ncbi:MAG: 50S ribosomal protein L20 [Chloroflexi bacterium]|nr:MAG: 50S ribosomal protein L20 [SAR202 cluster bacterium]MBR49248.1 50S ribosomal protein L20 [Chloroflexota bacterium]
MTRVKTGVVRRRRHKKTLNMTKGHQGVRHSLYRRAHESLIHALQYSYDHRKKKKGDMRRLWNVRLNAAARDNGLSYSKLIHGLNLAGIEINRKVLSELAITDPEAFSNIVDSAKEALNH